MAANPFENSDAEYHVLVNDEGQHSLWPVFADVPDGWKVIFGKDGREKCLDFIEKNIDVMAILIVLISVIPIVIEVVKARREKKRTASTYDDDPKTEVIERII